MSSWRFAVVILGVTVALSACEAQNGGLNRPDPNLYTLRFVPESVAMEVGTTATVSLFATETGANDIPIRIVEWAVDNQAIATLSDSAVSPGSPTSATILVKCQAVGRTSLAGAATVGYEVRLTRSMAVTCTAPTSTLR